MLFTTALDFVLRQEVGPWFNSTDPEVQQGLCATKLQQRKTGYVNIDGDSGEETKFGVSHAANPTLNIKQLTLAQAADVYKQKYWLAASCQKLPNNVDLVVFDSAVNHGVSTAVKQLQRAVGAVDDGVLGPKTLAAVAAADDKAIVAAILAAREQLYRQLAQKPSQQKFLAGWLNRLAALRAITA